MQIHVRQSTTADTLRAQNEMAAAGCQAPPRSCGPLRVSHPLTAVQEALLQRLGETLSKDGEALRAVVAVVVPSSSISLRMLDWLVTNYAKRRALCIQLPCAANVHVYDEYRAALAAFRRRNFDPFCRGLRRNSSTGGQVDYTIQLQCSDGTTLRTSLGQLNFLDWAHRRGVLAYAAHNSRAIEEDMQRAAARTRDRRSRHAARSALSAAPACKCRPFDSRRTISIGARR